MSVVTGGQNIRYKPNDMNAAQTRDSQPDGWDLTKGSQDQYGVMRQLEFQSILFQVVFGFLAFFSCDLLDLFTSDPSKET